MPLTLFILASVALALLGLGLAGFLFVMYKDSRSTNPYYILTEQAYRIIQGSKIAVIAGCISMFAMGAIKLFLA